MSKRIVHGGAKGSSVSDAGLAAGRAGEQGDDSMHSVYDSIYGRVGYLLKRAQHALRLSMDAVLAPLELSTAQYAALSALGGAAEAGEVALSGAEIARRCFVTPQTVTGLVAGLESRGLVRRRPHPTHGRVLDVAMTVTGRGALARAHAAVATVEERMLSDRATGERQQLAAWLHACARALEDPTASARGR